MNIGNNIKKYRNEINLTQQQLADAINKSKSTIEKYESSVITKIPLESLISIATTLNVSLDMLCNLDATTKSSKKENLIVDRDILLFALRYSLGRMTYAPYSVARSIQANIDNITSEDIETYINEIKDCENYGMDFDKKYWLDFAEYLEKVLIDREPESY